MIRLSLLAVYVAAAALYAGKDWYKSLCALVLLMAVEEHPDMPKTMLGIQGLNPWNLLLVVVVIAWLSSRRRDRLTWDLPGPFTAMLGVYFAVIVVGFVRMMLDRAYLDDSALSLTSEYFVNAVKWVVPGVLLYDGCRTRERFRMAVASVLGVYVLLAVQVIRWMPLSAATSGSDLSARAVKILVNEVGFHRVNMSAMLAGASWAVFAARPLAGTPRGRLWLLLTAGMVVFAQALTGGRAGYVTWAIVGLVLCLMRWRVYLLVTPLVVVGVLTLAPGVAQRMLQGFTSDGRDYNSRFATVRGENESGPDAYTITAGRSLIWPFVIEKISERPIVGYGRLAMVRTGLSTFLATSLDEGFAHPHNAYLEWLFDNGLVGFALVMPFYAMMVWQAFSLFRDSRSDVFVATGGMTLAFTLALLFAAMGSQTFYPREGWMGMWCLFFLTMRVRVQRAALLAPAVAAGRTARVRTFGRPSPLAAAATTAAAPTAATPPPAAAAGALSRLRHRFGPPPVVPIAEDAIWGPAAPADASALPKRPRPFGGVRPAEGRRAVGR